MVISGIAVASSYFFNTSQLPLYESHAKIAVEHRQTPGIMTAGDLTNNAVIARGYVDLIKTRPMLTEVSRQLPVTYSSGTLRNKISAKSNRNIINITARDADPVLAAIIANATAEGFIQLLQERQLSQLAEFEDTLSRYGIEQKSSLVAARAMMMGILSVVDPAVPSTRPYNSMQMSNIIGMGALAGIGISLLIVLAINYLDDRVRKPEDIKDIGELVPLGALPKFDVKNFIGYGNLNEFPQLRYAAESFRSIRSSFDLLVQRKRGRVKTVLISSPGTHEGKTTFAIGFSIFLAFGGKSVILVDADLRVPSIADSFELPAGPGLSELVRGETALEETLVSTPIENLRILSSGESISDPTLILGSSGMEKAIHGMKEIADVVVFDSSPLLSVSDPLIVASNVDSVVLVVDSTSTSISSVKHAVDRLKEARISHSFIGSVFNRMDNGLNSRAYRNYIG